ncbi:hypothetical protein GobsT_28360 [Gemmata obscuriglobus]|uniref:Uncharacterized protein n=1 Tax=Gemmata obscuriglobus TaxID=114 RepID=A0A2Z3GYT8_9BACT|nr:hypothetical protein [Gemmata obscuriglobus]AWM38933.1 hypothetical protein C1280_19360 [Gemmata obscuriglobus]QEG28064.1 hypothetical protein GobsT_28360 [Gemmata obscuriglobus]VTS05656.1 unnamed protein product [Gemmata obscuriglobus UQM 2246]
MTVPFILVICFAGIVCLIPLAFYLFWLAQITRREHPVAVAGTWDFTALVLGLSGFIVFGAGVVLTLLQSNFRFWMRGNFEAFRAVWIKEWVTWSVLVSFYLIAVVGGIGLTLLARRRSLVVYNVEPETFESLLNEMFAQLGRPLERTGNLWVSGVPLFELDTFEDGRTVTLRWVSDDGRLFEDVTRLLRTALTTHLADENQVTRWLHSAAVATVAVAGCSFALLIYYFTLTR